ncbi:hypothetical protein BC943DRAFT_379139 [Umbelopsis sp. AD052]|nr:hypothetical protein BC943DRAFT_379139 [Umbelopsis sp. AD052]
MPAGKEFDPDVDYYKLLEVEYNSTHEDIRRQYRKKALKVHPDKNPSPDAAALFHALSQAYEVLTDTQAKLAYDNVIKARVERSKRHSEMDSKRRAARDELEAREKAAKKRKTDEMDAEAKYKAELARMRESSGRRMQEEEEELRKMMEEEEQAEVPQASEMDCTLKIKWKKKKRTFEQTELASLFGKFGPVDAVVMTKQGSALVVFKSIVGAHAAITSQDTHPDLAIFETIDWATGKEPAIVAKLGVALKNNSVKTASESIETSKLDYATLSTHTSNLSSKSKPLFGGGPAAKPLFRAFGNAPAPMSFGNAPKTSDEDYETVTLMKLREAERRRLAEKVREEEKL